MGRARVPTYNICDRPSRPSIGLPPGSRRLEADLRGEDKIETTDHNAVEAGLPYVPPSIQRGWDGGNWL